MRSLLIISALWLTACGQPPQTQSDPRTVVGIDPEIAPYVDLYIDLKGDSMYYDIPVGFVDDLPGNAVGMCTRWSNGKRQIQIKRSYWDAMVPEYYDRYRISLIFHEFGHCDLNKDHSPSKDSIMYFENWGSDNFDELFGRTVTTLAHKAHVHDDTCVKDIEVE